MSLKRLRVYYSVIVIRNTVHKKNYRCNAIIKNENKIKNENENENKNEKKNISVTTLLLHNM